MENESLEEKVIAAWIALNGVLKDSRVTHDMSYNEAIVMRTVLVRYREDGVGMTAMQQIIRETHMLKSLVNRTINLLCERGLLEKRRDPADARNLFVLPIKEKLPEFLEVHERSRALAAHIIEVIGVEDATHFVSLSEKIVAAEEQISKRHLRKDKD